MGGLRLKQRARRRLNGRLPRALAVLLDVATPVRPERLSSRPEIFLRSLENLYNFRLMASS
ncbi:MAG TPA: hypothetical protein VHG72_21945 [Polyangia bacterium]|nr:hypothetical protein [Polyangia bacterium]